METIRIAAAQYALSEFKYLDEFATKATMWVEAAVEHRAQLLCFPDYASLELCSLLSQADASADWCEQLQGLQMLLSLYLDTFRQLAHKHQITLVLGSFPEKMSQSGQSGFMNRSYVVHPSGALDFQDKQWITDRGDRQCLLSKAYDNKVIDTRVGRLGISAGYDKNFASHIHQQVSQGAEIILVSSASTTLASAYQFCLASQAIALDNTCYVVHSALVGTSGCHSTLAPCHGMAGVYTPLASSLPSNAIQAQGQLDVSMWVYADLDLALIRRVRHQAKLINPQQRDYQHYS